MQLASRRIASSTATITRSAPGSLLPHSSSTTYASSLLTSTRRPIILHSSTTSPLHSHHSTNSYTTSSRLSAFPQNARSSRGSNGVPPAGTKYVSPWIPTNPQLIALHDLKPLHPLKKKKRYGRGPGSGLGKTCGKGHKGQGQRKGTRKRGFEGGSTPFWRRTPKLGNTNHDRYWKMLTPLSVKKIVDFIKAGRIDGSQLITMRTLYDSGCLTKIEQGVKLLSGGLTKLEKPIHIQLTDCSEKARTLLESSGGSVHLVWFNRMTLRAHLNPVHFLRKYGRLPKATGVPPPKKAAKYGFVVEHVDY